MLPVRCSRPTAVLLSEDRILVGEEAVKAGVFSPGDYADCFNGDMGRPAFHRAAQAVRFPGGAERMC